MLIYRSYKFRIYPSKNAERKFIATLNICRELYNAALQERRDAYEWWKQHGQWIGAPKPAINYFSQSKALTEIRAVREDVANVPVSAARDPLKRVHKAFDAFFARVKRGDTPGYPRFRSKARYDSFAYVDQWGWLLRNNKLTLFHIGNIKIKMHQEVIGKAKTLTIKRDGTQWYASFMVEQEAEIPAHEGFPIGIDVGLEYFASMSDGSHIDNPRLFRKSEKHLAHVQRKLATFAKADPLRKKYKPAVANAHRKVRNQRADFLHKASVMLAKKHNLIVVEKIQTANLSRKAKPKIDEAKTEAQGITVYAPNGASAKSGLNKSISDAGWSTFISMLKYKAANAGSQLIEIDPKYTSQICPSCGVVKKKELSERWHTCPCGLSTQRDHAAALVILARGLSGIGIQPVIAPK